MQNKVKNDNYTGIKETIKYYKAARIVSQKMWITMEIGARIE